LKVLVTVPSVGCICNHLFYFFRELSGEFLSELQQNQLQQMSRSSARVLYPGKIGDGGVNSAQVFFT